jgi:hypothetical protein
MEILTMKLGIKDLSSIRLSINPPSNFFLFLSFFLIRSFENFYCAVLQFNPPFGIGGLSVTNPTHKWRG